jgi:hypothetical protein
LSTGTRKAFSVASDLTVFTFVTTLTWLTGVAAAGTVSAGLGAGTTAFGAGTAGAGIAGFEAGTAGFEATTVTAAFGAGTAGFEATTVTTGLGAEVGPETGKWLLSVSNMS